MLYTHTSCTFCTTDSTVCYTLKIYSYPLLQADNPHAKAVFALRNPVERAWSDFRFMLDIYQRRQMSFPDAVARTLQPMRTVSSSACYMLSCLEFVS